MPFIRASSLLRYENNNEARMTNDEAEVTHAVRSLGMFDIRTFFRHSTFDIRHFPCCLIHEPSPS